VSVGSSLDPGATGLESWSRLYEPRVYTEFAHRALRLDASCVATDGTEHTCRLSQPGQMDGEVERSATDTRAVWEQIPENFANG
jgi:hypothetical protein